MEEFESYVKNSFGECEEVFHEMISPDIHLDIIIVPPNDKDDYYKLITMGAGAYAMNVPKKLKRYDLRHAEYVIYLPKKWNINSSDMKDYWPIGMLKKIARVPIMADTWMGPGHTMHVGRIVPGHAK